MTTGLGFSIGAVNSVTASVTGVRTRPVVRSRRTAVTFDSAGGLRVGGVSQFSMAVTDFADLSRDPESMVVGGRIWSPANLVAAAVNGLREAEPVADESGAVATYPATYSDKEVFLLRQALDLSGAGDVALVPEPIAAAEWLEAEHGPLEPGFVLIYDLGGTSLDITIVRVGPDWANHPMVGKPLRSFDFGGRPLGAMIARYAGDVGSSTAPSTSILSMIDIDGLRAAHVHDTLDLVRSAVRSAGLTLSDIGRILVIGGASRPAEVARTLAELGRPLVVSADPGQTVAVGAAHMAARTMALAASGGKAHAPRVAVFSSAAVVSAVAMSAVTVFGGSVGIDAAPVLEHFPGLEPPTDTLLYDASLDHLTGHRDAWIATPAGWAPARSFVGAATGSPKPSAYGLFITPVAHTTTTTAGPTIADTRAGNHTESRTHSGATPYLGNLYADPAYFINPLPFGQPAPQPGQPAAPAQPATPIAGTPASPPAAAPGTTPQINPAPADPAPTAPQLGTVTDTPVAGTTPGSPTGTTPSAPATGETGTSTGTPATGGPSGETATGPTTGGPSTGGSDTSTSGGTSTGGTSSGETSSGGTTSGGSTTGGTTSGGSTSNGSTSGSNTSTGGTSSSGGSTSSGTSTSGGSTSGGSTSGGSTSAGSTSGGSTSGGSSSGGSSSGGSSSGGTH